MDESNCYPITGQDAFWLIDAVDLSLIFNARVLSNRGGYHATTLATGKQSEESATQTAFQNLLEIALYTIRVSPPGVGPNPQSEHHDYCRLVLMVGHKRFVAQLVAHGESGRRF